MNKQDLAKFGEDLAVKFLSHNDYKILQRNFHSVYGEIDIICQQKDQLIFVEVKTRKSLKFGTALEAVTSAKKEKIIKTAFNYLAKNELDVPIRYDIITIQYIARDKEYQLQHIRNAFFARPYSSIPSSKYGPR